MYLEKDNQSRSVAWTSLFLPPSLLFTWVTNRQWCFSFLKRFAEISSSILSRQQRLVEFFNGPPGSVLADCKRKAAHVLNVRLFGMVRRIALWSICIFALFAQQTWTYIRLYCKAFLGIKIKMEDSQAGASLAAQGDGDRARWTTKTEAPSLAVVYLFLNSTSGCRTRTRTCRGWWVNAAVQCFNTQSLRLDKDHQQPL